MNARDIDLSSVNTICFDCAQLLGFEQKYKAVGVWTDNCEVCHQRKACTNLWHDWKQVEKGEAK